MKDKAVLFNDASVRGVLAGAKHSFRRPIDPQPELCHGCQTCQFRCDHFLGRVREFAEVGQTLWVKESWMPPRQIELGAEPKGPPAFYRADYNRDTEQILRHWKYKTVGWNSAMTMARCYSRLELKVTDYRVERLHAISDQEAKLEGASSVDDFRASWDSVLARAGFGWDANPYVHVVAFDVTKCLTPTASSDHSYRVGRSPSAELAARRPTGSSHVDGVAWVRTRQPITRATS